MKKLVVRYLKSESASVLLNMGVKLYMINSCCYVHPYELDQKLSNGSKAFDHWIRNYIKKYKKQYDEDIAEKVQIFTSKLPNLERTRTKLVLISLFHAYYNSSHYFKRRRGKNVSLSDKENSKLQL